jgi:N-acetylmuramoyl-L-alanine amidase
MLDSFFKRTFAFSTRAKCTLVSMSFFALMFSSPTSHSQTSPIRVVVDPGHGGADTGAVRYSLKESELVLSVALKLKEIIKTDPRVQLTLTRTNDSSRSLQERVQWAERFEADLFISLHANTEFTQKARGVEIYFQSSLGSDEEAQYLASIENKSLKRTNIDPSERKKTEVEKILEDLKRVHSLRASHKFSRKLAQIWSQSSRTPINIRQAPFYVITKSKMPSILVELGFLSHPQEAQKLSSSAHQEQIASRIYQGILQYKEMMDNLRSHSL